MKETGLNVTKELETCTSLSQNTTVQDCPINQHKDANEFLVLVHNQANIHNKQLSRVKLPSDNYKAQIWNKTSLAFSDVDADVFEQSHFDINYKQ
jgi:hypothetical protein